MGDQHTSGHEPQQDHSEQLDLLTLEDRVKREVAVIFGRHNLVTSEGNSDLAAVAELIYPVVSKAVVHNPGDRAKVGVTPTSLMERFFSDVPGPDEWAEYDEEETEFREAVYKKVKSEVFRVLSTNPDGLVQARLGSNGGMVLCRTSKKLGREETAYVTRNRKCIHEDNNAPVFKAAQRALDRAAALTALAIDRVPEHGTWFNRQYKDGLKKGVDSGAATIRAALDVVENAENSDDE